MTKQVQRRRGSSTQHTGFTGAEGEISVNTTNKSIHVHDGTTAGGFEAARADLNNVDSTANLSINNLTVTGDVSFGDNDKAVFGAGSDLQIYHDGSNSFVNDTGTGNLILRGANVSIQDASANNQVFVNNGGAVDIRYAGSAKLVTTATGVDVTGTVTATKAHIQTASSGSSVAGSGDELFVEGSGDAGITVGAGNASKASLFFADDGDSAAGRIRYDHSDNSMQFGTGGQAERMRINSSGNVGIGTTSPDRPLEVVATNTTMKISGSGVSSTGIVFETNGVERKQIGIPSGDTALAFYSDAGSTEAMRIDSSGNVGIGTSSPSRPLDVVADANDNPLRLRAQGGGTSAYITFSNNDATATNALIGNPAANTLAFYTNGFSERLRIDSSGNLLVGTTSSTIYGGTTTGINLNPNGATSFNRASGQAAMFNRISTDGDVVQFRRDGSVVGSIGSANSGTDLYIDSSDDLFLRANGLDGLQIFQSGGSLQNLSCFTNFYPSTDNAFNVGTTSFRWDNIYATNGTIQTSDANEKQQIAPLTDAEITAAKAISALFKTFKWNSAVETKGDAARTHTGVIAQDVQAAMTAAGLDAGDYAFFISNTWYVDADGNEVEADAEGAIEKNRKGIRYAELFAFVGAATEQRLANIETRLAALEAN